MIPIEESLIYIRPLYLRAAGGQIPELKRVIVAYQNNIVMETTGAAHYARALQAQRDGNWALYGEEIKKLGDVLEKMKTRR